MCFRIRLERPVPKEIRRIALEEIDRACAELRDSVRDRDAAIHQARKRCKQLRGLLRLCRGALGGRYARENARFRDAARRVSGLRDAEVLIETYDWLLDRDDGSLDRRRLSFLRRGLTLDKKRCTGDTGELGGPVAALEAALVEARGEVDAWARGVTSLEDTLEGFRHNYRKGRKAMREAFDQPRTELFHEWRKRTKYLSHHLKLLEGLWPPVLRAHRLETARLADLLGREHDLALFQDHLDRKSRDEGGREVLVALSDRIVVEREALRLEARALGRRAFGESPATIARRLERWMPP